MQKSIEKQKIRPLKIVNPENFILKIGKCEYVGDASTRVNLMHIGSVGAFLQVCEIYHFCDFLTVLSFLLGHAPRSNHWTIFHALWLKGTLSGLAQWMRSLGGNMLPKLPKNGRE